MNKDTSGSAAPTGFIFYGTGFLNGGLTKREYFAAMALQGLLAHYGNEGTEGIADTCLKYADAMIAQGERG